MSNIEHFFCLFGLVAFLLSLIGLFSGIIWLIVDYNGIKDKIKSIKDIENRYYNLWNTLRGIESTVNCLYDQVRPIIDRLDKLEEKTK